MIMVRSLAITFSIMLIATGSAVAQGSRLSGDPSRHIPAAHPGHRQPSPECPRGIVRHHTEAGDPANLLVGRGVGARHAHRFTGYRVCGRYV